MLDAIKQKIGQLIAAYEKERMERIRLQAALEQAEKLIQLDHDGELHFVLVSRGDVERAERLLLKQTALLEEIQKSGYNQNTFDYDKWSDKWEAANG